MHTNIHTVRESRLIFQNIERISEQVPPQNPNEIPLDPPTPEMAQALLRSAIRTFSQRIRSAPTAQGRQIVIRNILESDSFSDDGKGRRNALLAGLGSNGDVTIEDLTSFANDNNPTVAARALSGMRALYDRKLNVYISADYTDENGRRRDELGVTRQYINGLLVALKAATTDVDRNRIIAELTSRDLATTFYKLQLGQPIQQEMVYVPLQILASTAPAGSVLVNAPEQVRTAINAGMDFAKAKAEAATRRQPR